MEPCPYELFLILRCRGWFPCPPENGTMWASSPTKLRKNIVCEGLCALPKEKEKQS